MRSDTPGLIISLCRVTPVFDQEHTISLLQAQMPQVAVLIFRMPPRWEGGEFRPERSWKLGQRMEVQPVHRRYEYVHNDRQATERKDIGVRQITRHVSKSHVGVEVHETASRGFLTAPFASWNFLFPIDSRATNIQNEARSEPCSTVRQTVVVKISRATIIWLS